MKNDHLFHVLKLTIAPLLSLFVFTLGNGLFNTLITIRLHAQGSPTFLIGAMTSAYYIGLVCGSFRAARFILRVGHIRAYATFGSLLTAIVLLQGLLVNEWLWLLFRLLCGFATAGIFVVVESWLLVLGTVKIRGQVLALYMVSLYAAQSLGQFFINLASPTTLTLFVVTAILSTLSVIPLAITKVNSPQMEEPSSLSFLKLYQTSASGVIGCFSAGLILAAIYGLLPLYIAEQTNNTSRLALFMAVTIFGGMALQYPVGRLSDMIERRTVMIAITLLTIIASFVVMISFHNIWLMMLMLFLFGGLTFTLYPLSISHASDVLAVKDIISGTQGLLLAYSLGAAIGPILAPLFIYSFGPNGLFIYFVAVNIPLLLFLSWRRVHVAPVAQDEQFVSLPQTTPITAELDPRSDN